MATFDKKRRLAVTMPRFSKYGGAESFAWRLSEALAARGHEVDFICGRVETEPPAGVTPVVVGRFGGLRLFKVLWFALMADRCVRKKKYDLVFGMANTINQDILRIGGGPISVFWRLSQQAWPAGFPRWFKMFRRRLSPVNWLIHWLDAQRMHRTPRIVTVSHFVRDLIVEAHPYRAPDSIDVIYNRPDLSRFSHPSEEERTSLRAELDISTDNVVIGTAATNFALKGIAPLLHVLAGLPENHVLHVAGGRKPDKYLRLARELGVEHRVRFLGRVDDMQCFYRRIDIFILASFYDACSNAVLEALACGCRVASSALNGSAYFLPKKWIFPDPADVSAMTELLERMSVEDRPTPFEWPTDIEIGLEPYIKMIENTISNK
ncbi:glycosyltransferase family 4 protein [Pseudodesulfovibrio piezophilus]|uniref:Glycosyl transferase group 1 n=1 Tax=Pseudodesulfovibrio piezophilus (strain DSM 21447 / JCM 15486 / C1TLV30) TaxID=1322246 RepID=M1WR26_PSEP2|nr:glycosyltransferase family 4 protein [Pseudodesulfovibrio piezophilus]CCH48057.1 Glycosyl transferase group 1 [Pseudodesulfovibrio piezophilus C1TLV30]